MIVLPRLCLVGLFGLCSFALRSAAPPNDNFVDRIVLTGNSVTFTGILAGATKEFPYETGGGPYLAFGSSQSVWWEWTATTTSIVTIQILDPAPGLWTDGLVVYTNPKDGFPTNCA